LIQECIDLKISDAVMTSQERNKFRARRSKRTQSLKHSFKGYKGYKDGLQPESLADGNWLVKQSQPVSKVETKSDTNLRSLYES